MRGVWAHTTYVGLAYPAERRARNPRGRKAPIYAVSTPTKDSRRYSWTARSGTRKDLPTRIAGK
ncbi:hypothetical protein GCM10023237_27610 [Streptomyces coeruleoprunus]